MSGTEPVSRPPFFMDGLGGRLLILAVVALTVAILKPWETFVPSAPTRAPVAIAAPSRSALPDPTPRDLRIYDPLIFGDHELQPAWGLWPAGYLVSFGFAMLAEPSPSPTSSASGIDPVRPDPSAIHTRVPTPPYWPEAIDVPMGNHLLLIGVDTPLGFRVDRVRLFRYIAGGGRDELPVVLPPSPWPTHFTVIGIDGGDGALRPDFWAPGRYRLDLAILPGPIERTIEIRIDGPSSEPSMVPSEAPVASSPSP